MCNAFNDCSELEEAWVARCKDIAELMCAKLPRELRDIIYKHACVEEEMLYVKHWELVPKPIIHEFSSLRDTYANVYPNHTRGEALKDFNPYDLIDYRNYDDKPPDYDLDDRWLYPAAFDIAGDERTTIHERYVLQPYYVGSQTAREASETYYSKNSFCLVFDKYLHDFLTVDLFRVGVRPYEHVRDIKVSFRCEPLTEKLADCKNGEKETAFFKTKMERLLQGFALTKDNPRLHVTLMACTAFDEEMVEGETQRSYFNILEALWRPYMALREAGIAVELEHCDEMWLFDGVLKTFDTTCIELRKVSAHHDFFLHTDIHTRIGPRDGLRWRCHSHAHISHSVD
jgi:hypothetical protein